MIQKDDKRIIGTPDYIAPEIIKGEIATNFSVDYWSLGVIMYEMLVGVPPFNDTTIEGIFNNILTFNIEWPQVGEEEDCISPNAYDLIQKLLTSDYNKRIGHTDFQEIKKHPFFKGIDWVNIYKSPGMIVPEN